MVQGRAVTTAVRCDRLLDAVVTLLATWTLVYHASLVLGLNVEWAAGLEVIALAVYALLARRLSGPETDGATAPASRPVSRATHGAAALAAVAITGAAVAALSMATSGPWALVWVPWLVAAGAGTWWAARENAGALGLASTETDRGTIGERRTVVVVLAWATGLAGMALFMLRPNPDDLYYLNLSQWVAEHGTFPLRDTIFANLTYPMSNWPPIASYDGLVGAVAHLTGTRAAAVEYVVVPPLATALSVLALWRLLRAWEVPQVALTLSAALVFLLLDGSSSYGSPGNLFLTRLWQGKVILLCLLVPTLLVYALRFVERPSRPAALRLFLGGTASVGLSTTAIFLTPLIALAGTAPLLPRSRWRAVSGFVVMAAYPLTAGVATKALGGRSADDFGTRRQYRFDPAWLGHEIFLTGLLAAVAVFAVLVGCLLVPHPAARVTTGLLVFLTGLVLAPGVTHLSYAVTGLGPTLWRVSWGCSVAALVGLAAVRAGAWLRRRWAVGVAAVLGLVLLVAFGSPIWAGDTGNTWQAPFHWQRSDGSRAVAERIIAASRPGGVVLAPDSLSITVAVTTTDVRTVAPRAYYMYYLQGVLSFHYRERLALVDFANDVGPWRQSVISNALQVLLVDVACVASKDVRRARALRHAGFTPMLVTSAYRCLQRT